MKILISLLLSCLTINVSGQLSTYLDVQYDNIDGVDENLLSLDVYIPDGVDPKPIMIYVHGGAWAIGDKSVFHEKMNHFTSKGYIFVSINYQLSPFPFELDNPDRITFPTHPQDVGKAISFVLDNAPEYGGDLTKVSLIGHSAGAHLVSLMMTDDSYLQVHGYSRADIKCGCSLDTGGYDINDWLVNKPQTTIDLYNNAFTDDLEIKDDASPINHIEGDEDMPEILIVMQNTFLRVGAAERFADAILEIYPDNKVALLPTEYEHDELNQFIGDNQDSMSIAHTEFITNWFDTCTNRNSTSSADVDADRISIFPNPAHRKLIISDHISYTIMDAMGRNVLHGSGKEIDISNLQSGIYYLKAKDITKKEKTIPFIVN